MIDSPALDWSRPLPLEGWFLVAPSHALRVGQVMNFESPGGPVVVYRGEDKRVRAVAAHCPHMGAHLRHGAVRGNAIQCALHHWQWQPTAADATIVPGHRCLPWLPVRESGSGIWFCHSRAAVLPSFPDATDANDSDLHFRHGAPVFLRCPWQGIMANAFDLNHFETVHQRAMHAPPQLTEHEDRLDFDYTSRVVGNEPADRIMRLISGDRIEVSIKLWQGSVFTVRTRTRKRETFLWLSVLPSDGGSLVKPVYAVRRGPGLAPLRLRLAAWLFGAFLRKDVAILDGIRFAPDITEKEDSYLWSYLRFIEKRTRKVLSP